MSERVGAPVRVAGLDGHLLAVSARGDGRHQVVSAHLNGRPVVIKLYGRKRPVLPTLARAFGHRFLVAKTGLGAATRCAVEARLLRLWREHGFAVPEILDLPLPEPDARPHLVLEQIDGPTVHALLRDPSVPSQRLVAGMARFGAEWCRRHALAERLREPGLVHAHPSFAHLLDHGGEWASFDFEYAYTDPRRIEALVAVEIAGFVASLQRAAGARAELLLRALVSAYPERDRLARAGDSATVGRFPLLDALTARIPALRARGPRKLREGLHALAKVLSIVVAALAVSLSGGATAETASYVPPDCGAELEGASDEVLLRCFAPIIVADGVEDSFNRPGALVLERGALGGLSVRVDPDRPTLYAEARGDIVGDELVVQLVYRVHFEKIPLRFSRYFFEAHRNPGLLVVVTFEPRSARVPFVTVAHACGCYTAVLPTEHVPRAALPRDHPTHELRVFGQTLPAVLRLPSSGARPEIRLEPASHRITDVRMTNQAPAGRTIEIPLRPMASLRDMAVEGGDEGERGSVFHDSWPARGHLRGAWNPIEGLTVFGLVALDPMVGMDKDFGDPAETGTEFYTMIAFFRQSASRLDRFDRLLRTLGYRTDTLW